MEKNITKISTVPILWTISRYSLLTCSTSETSALKASHETLNSFLMYSHVFCAFSKFISQIAMLQPSLANLSAIDFPKPCAPPDN